MSKIKIGAIFEIPTPKGNAYLHYIHKDNVTGELIRVLPGLYTERPSDFENLVSSEEKFIISFPLLAAKKQKIVEEVGFSPTSNYAKPKFMRSEHRVRGEFLGWHIVDTDTWQRHLVKDLNAEQRKLSPWGIWNDTLLVERLISDWTLEGWR